MEMTYESIKETIEKFNYKLPIVAQNDKDEQMSINEVYEKSTMHGMPADDLHCYQVYTYLNDGRIRFDRFYENGMTSTEIRQP